MTPMRAERLSTALLDAMRGQAQRGLYVTPQHVVKLIDEVTRLRIETAQRGPCGGCPFAGCDCQWQGGK